MITFVAPPLLPFLQLTIFICLLLPLLLLISIFPTVSAAAVVVTTDEGDTAMADEAVAATTTTEDVDGDDMLTHGNEERATLPDDHDVCLTTITPGRHCWWCWRICDAVCWLDDEAEGEGLQLPAASATVGVMDTDTIAGLPLGLLGVLLEGMLDDEEEEEEVEEVDWQVPTGGVRNFR